MDVLDVALRLADALDRAGVGYFVGGSLASSLQGEPRSTNDIDLVVDLAEDRVGALVAALGPDFEVDEEALRRAARERSSWNVFHLPPLFGGPRLSKKNIGPGGRRQARRVWRVLAAARRTPRGWSPPAGELCASSERTPRGETAAARAASA